MKNSRYKDVIIYAMIEYVHYHLINDDGSISDDIQEYDTDPQLKYWNVFGCDGMIDITLSVDEYPDLRSVQEYIDNRIKKLKEK